MKQKYIKEVLGSFIFCVLLFNYYYLFIYIISFVFALSNLEKHKLGTCSYKSSLIENFFSYKAIMSIFRGEQAFFDDTVKSVQFEPLTKVG
jgi:hypothetical protein